MTKPIIAIDIDDVLVDSAAATIEAYNATWGTEATLADYYVKPDPAVWQVDNLEAVVKRVHVYQASPAFFELSPTAGAVVGVKRLAERYNLCAVTGRWEHIIEPTKQWLEQHFPGLFTSVVSSSFFHASKQRSKGDICLELGAQYLIDDHIDHCKDAANVGVGAILFGNYPWNKAAVLSEGVTRCNNWQAVLEYFEKEPVHV